MKTAHKLIYELQKLSPELKDKPVVIEAPNGMFFDAEIKLKLVNPMNPLDHSADNLSEIVISI